MKESTLKDMESDQFLNKEEMPEMNTPHPHIFIGDRKNNTSKAAESGRINNDKTKSILRPYIIKTSKDHLGNNIKEDLKNSSKTESDVKYYRVQLEFNTPSKISERNDETSTLYQSTSKLQIMDDDNAMSITLNGTPKNEEFIDVKSSEKKLKQNQSPVQKHFEPEIKFNNLKEMEKFDQETVEEFNAYSDVEDPRKFEAKYLEKSAIIIKNLDSNTNSDISPVVHSNDSGNSTTKNFVTTNEIQCESSDATSRTSPHTYSITFEDFDSGFDIDREVKELKEKVNKNLPAKTKGKNRR
jgi:hypothetical protein